MSRRIPMTPETIVIARLMNQDGFDIALTRGLSPDDFEEPLFGAIYRAMLQSRAARLPHDLATLWFALEDDGEDVQRAAVELATEFRDFRYSTLSLSVILDRTFGERVEVGP